jgi:hypothetical protein
MAATGYFLLFWDFGPLTEAVGILSQNRRFGVGCVHRAFPVGYDPQEKGF